MVTKKLFLFVIMHSLLLVKSEDVKRSGRDFYNYYPQDEKRQEYQVFHQPAKYFSVNEGYPECENNPMMPLLGRGLNLLLLKFGALGIIKVITTFIILTFLAKIPLFLLKLTFLKSFFLPFLVAPLLVHLFTQQMSAPSDNTVPDKPGESPAPPENMMGMGEMNMEMERQISDNFTSTAWQSIKIFAESDQCVERISCMIGASNNDSSVGKIFSRVLKFLYKSSPPRYQKRMALIKDAYYKGSQSSVCSEEEYKCESPELVIQHGLSKIKIL